MWEDSTWTTQNICSPAATIDYYKLKTLVVYAYHFMCRNDNNNNEL